MIATTRFGVIADYVHPGAQLGALIEVCCESRAASRSILLKEKLRVVRFARISINDSGIGEGRT